MDLDPEGRRLPIKVDCATNGEYSPVPLPEAARMANELAHHHVGEAARRLGLKRRAFLKTLAGSAATLLAFNEAHSAVGARGGSYALPKEAAFDQALAAEHLAGDELIFDIQTHCVDPSGAWRQGADGERWARVLSEVFPRRRQCEGDTYSCYSAEQLIKDVFLDSDTTAAVVSALWGARGSNPTPIEYAAETRAIVERMGGRQRVLIHGGVLPNEPGALETMEVMAREFQVNAWKTYPQWGPDGVGYFMDDERFGIPLVEKARDLGVKVICAHRGLPLGNLEYRYSHPADIARVAAKYPDVSFICYHSGFEPGKEEGRFDPEKDQGVDRLIRAHQEQGFTPNRGNLYAELGSVWRYCMARPDQAAHLLGKLLKYFGEERICWGTDALWYGSPQDQIQAFRTFRISGSFQERFGYPPLTDRARRRIFGLNSAGVYGLDVDGVRQAAASDSIGKLRASYGANANPSFRTYGPKTRREFLRLQEAHGGRPG